jgi:hypothetical protein
MTPTATPEWRNADDSIGTRNDQRYGIASCAPNRGLRASPWKDPVTQCEVRGGGPCIRPSADRPGIGHFRDGDRPVAAAQVSPSRKLVPEPRVAPRVPGWFPGRWGP